MSAARTIFNSGEYGFGRSPLSIIAKRYLNFSFPISNFSFFIHRRGSGCIYCTINGKEGCRMKVVVVRTPGLLAGILRMMFHIRKETSCTDT